MAANPNESTAPARALHQRLYQRLSAERTRADLDRLNRLTQRGPVGILRAAIAGYSRHNDTLWASALTYTLSLSLIPILAVALSAVKGLIGIDRVKPLIEHYLAVNSPQITDEMLQFVGNINAATLGAVGGATLLVTVVLTIGTIEQALNTIFNVAQGRTWLRKFTDYLSITFTLPVLIAAAMAVKDGLHTSVPQVPGLGWLVATIPIWAGFSFLYLFFPNTRVRWDCAALGGLVAAILLEIGQWAYLKFQVGAGRYQAIYGALAAVPILLTWIYIAWSIVLAGAELTAAAQGTESAFSLDYHSPDFVRTALLLTVFRAGERAQAPKAPICSIDRLAAELGAPKAILRPILDRLAAEGIILEADKAASPAHQGIFLARDSSELTLAEVFAAFERPADDSLGDQRIDSVLRGIAASQHEALGAITVKDLVKGSFEPNPAPRAPAN
ncbi:MAG TPA: YhjD/YihY/BrkB family envelope integrity protein [Candidatus Binataceae bacterium]|nr:YhjD/YihY/BrkB family envelope integrity protein [Candidatus Binataceae bacterium]